MGNVVPIDAVAEQGADPVAVVIGGLVVDEYLGMVVDGELLLGPGVVELEAKEARVGVELGRFLKAQLFGKEQLIVTGGDGVAHGQAGNGLPQAAAAHADIVGLVEDVEHLFQLFGRVLVIEGQVQATVGP